MNDELNSLVAEIRSGMEEMIRDLSLVELGKRGWKTAAFRARKQSLALEKLFRVYRKKSVAAQSAPAAE